MGARRRDGGVWWWTTLGMGAFLALFGGGCERASAPGGDSDIVLPETGPRLFTAQDAGICLEPEEGCACEPGSEPEPCYLEPLTLPGGGTLCRAGSRYCRDGVWSACEDVRRFVLEGGGAALVIGPRACNPCDPACAASYDRPSASDLTPRNSGNVTYDGSRGGVILRNRGSTGGALPDRDGDGVPDVADDFPDDPGRWSRSGDGIYHTLPFGGPVRVSPLDFTTRVTTADVYLLMDTTGSMGGEISNLKAGLTSGTYVPGCPGGVVAAIKCMIPNAWIGVGRHDDYPVAPWGGYWDWVYRNLLDMTPSVSAAQAAVNTLNTHWGYDWPESQTQALWAIATGNGLGRFLAPRRGCPAGRWGYPCFRPDTIPIVVLFTDAPFHNGPSGSYRYASRFWGLSPPTWSQVVDALTARNVKVVVVESANWGRAAEEDIQALLTATGSVDAAGAPYMISIASNGRGLSRAVVDAIWNLANNTRFDVSARPVDNPATPIDERRFVRSIVVRGWGPGNCRGASGSVALQCTPGTQVDFRVAFRNNFVMPTASPQVFDFEIHVLLDGTIQQRVPVRIVVPPVRPLYPPTGYYLRDYDASAFCSIPPQHARWGRLQWDVSTPGRTVVRFEITTAATAAGLTGPPDLTLSVPPRPDRMTFPGVDVGAELRAAGISDQLPYLRVRAVLVASPDRSASPVLRSFALRYDCISGT